MSDKFPGAAGAAGAGATLRATGVKGREPGPCRREAVMPF